MNCHNYNSYTRGDTDQLSFKSFAKFSFKKIVNCSMQLAEVPRRVLIWSIL